MSISAQTGRVLCFGEMLLRLTPTDGEQLLQSHSLTVHPGGAEANVAVSLARLGAPAVMATVLPDNALGRHARDEMRRHGVDTGSIVFAPGRMGLYFLTPGAVRRPSEVLYDRAGSAFIEHVGAAFDWDTLLDGADWLHVSGVTPATGPSGSAAAIAVVEAAVRRGVQVSFDGNFRGRLWETWDGDPRGTLSQMLAGATVAFADERDFALVLNQSFEDKDPILRRRQAAEAAFAAFPRLQRIACTRRTQDTISEQSLSAIMFTRDKQRLIETRTGDVRMTGVVDRVGTGDAFAAGVLFGVSRGWDHQQMLDFGLGAATLKHSLRGDFNLFSEADVRAAASDQTLDIKR